MKITVGVVQKPFGIKGELKIKPQTDFVEERFKVGNERYINLNNDIKQYEVESMRKHQGSLLVKFKGLDSLNDVEFFHRALIQINESDQHDLEEGEFYFKDLIDCEVYVEETKLGHVSEVLDLPAHPVLRIKTDSEDILIPFVEAFIIDVDLDNNQIEVKNMEGLF